MDTLNIRSVGKCTYKVPNVPSCWIICHPNLIGVKQQQLFVIIICNDSEGLLGPAK